MKQLEDYVKDGWKVQVTLTPSDQGVQYDVWAYEHPELLALEGKGDSISAMLQDLQECEAEIYPFCRKSEK